MQYGAAVLTDSITALQAKIESGEVDLEFQEGRGYLDSILAALEISPSSQLLVFSRTSLQQHLISPQTPRAIYFNDDTYVAWVQQSGSIEIGAMDPNLGPVFFTLSQSQDSTPSFNREFRQCLRCHDSLSLTGGGTPRFMMSSNYTGTAGQLVSHEGSIMTDSRTPIASRWGGWYVSGIHGDQRHLGNVLIESAEDVSDENLAITGNKASIAELTDLSSYLTPYSDIVALLVIEHQIEVQNQIARVNYYSKTLLADQSLDQTEVQRALQVLSDDLLASLFMVGQPGFSETVTGSSGFREYFEAQALIDEQSSLLRELNLETRLFEYPLSYLIYSDAIKNLPEPLLRLLKVGIDEVLTGESANDQFDHISPENRQIIAELIRENPPF